MPLQSESEDFMPLNSISVGIWITYNECSITAHRNLLDELAVEESDNIFRFEKSKDINSATVIEFFYFIRSQPHQIEEEVEELFAICTSWLMKQNEDIFKVGIREGLKISFEIGGWLDDGNQLYDFVIPAKLLFQLGRLELSVEMTLNDYHR